MPTKPIMVPSLQLVGFEGNLMHYIRFLSHSNFSWGIPLCLMGGHPQHVTKDSPTQSENKISHEAKEIGSFITQ